jgi:L-malate glycosyltransferase
MRIAIISMIREPWGGSEELWASMAQVALQEGHEVIHSSFDFGIIAEKEKYLIGKGLKNLKRRGYIPGKTSKASRLLKKGINFLLNQIANPFNPVFDFHPDYILYNGTCYSILNEKYLLRKIRGSGANFGILAHFNQENGEDLSSRDIVAARQIFTSATHLFFVSLRTWKNAEKSLSVPFKNAFLVRNPVNLSSLSLVPFPKDPAVQFALVGNLIRVHKGQDIAILVLSRAEWRNREWHLNIFGSGPDELFLNNLVLANNLQSRVSFHGRVGDIRSVWEKNHLLLMPSRMEGMPLAVVEAMICGRPSVLTDVGGHREWVDDESEGFMATRATENEFSQALERCWSARDRWEQIGIRAHQKAMKMVDPEPGKTLLNLLMLRTPKQP